MHAAHVGRFALTAAFIVTSSALAADSLVGRAVLPAATFADGPTSGRQLVGPINGIPVPFIDKQPVQGFSAIHDNGDGTFRVMSDNGFGGIENSSDYNLRVYTIKPNFETAAGGPGTIEVLSFIELRDPDAHVPFAITNHFSAERVLTGADFDIESMQVMADGTIWFGDEFGPFLIHTDATGKVLAPPVALPDFENPGKDVRAVQNPFNEERSALRVMNAMRNHARLHGNEKTLVFSPSHVMFADNNANTFVANRQSPPAGSGLVAASSEIFNISSMQQGGYSVIPYTVNDAPRMLELMNLKVNGIISDRSDILYATVAAYDANNDGTPGDFLTADGLIDIAKFDAQGHRGSRGLRPENTLPAMEAGLNNLMTTLETDCGVTADGFAVLDHDPLINSTKARKADGSSYGPGDEVLVKNLTLAEIQSTFIADKLLPAFPAQSNDLGLSPVAVAFAAEKGLMNPYVMPSLDQLFDFVEFYVTYYKTGAGSSHPDATKRWKNAEKIRFNVETKRNPRQQFVNNTVDAEAFAQTVADAIVAAGLSERADIQSFDFSTLLVAHEQYPQIRTVCLFGDFPIYADPTIPGSDVGTNLQDEFGVNTPWLAGLYWPYRSTSLSTPFRAASSGGYEGMAKTSDGTKLLALLERPLTGDPGNELLISEFDPAMGAYTGVQYAYLLEPAGTNIGDFVMFNPTQGLIIERDGSQGSLTGFKRVYEIKLNAPGTPVTKGLVVDLINIADPNLISMPGLPGDVGLGNPFAFPFTTIEDVFVVDADTIGILNDNNFPFSIGRHVGAGAPDDDEFILIDLDAPLGSATLNGDLNADGVVGNDDLGILLGDWGACGRGSCAGDLNGDQVVNGLDLGLLLASWTE